MFKKQFIKSRQEKLMSILILLGVGLLTYFIISLRRALTYSLNTLNQIPPDVGNLPNQLFFWVGLILVCIPFLNFKLRKEIRVISLSMLGFFIFLSYPLFSPYGYPYSRDSVYAFQLSEIIQEKQTWHPTGLGFGLANVYNHYPLMYFVNVFISAVTFIPLSIVFMWAFGLLRFALISLFIYLIFKEVLNREYALWGLFLYYISPSLTNSPHHEGFAIIFLLGLLYSILRLTKNPSVKYKMYMILFSVFIIISHHFTSYITAFWLAFLVFVPLVVKKLKFKKLKESSLSIPSGLSLNFLLLFIVIFFSWGFLNSFGDIVYHTSGAYEGFGTLLNPLFGDVEVESNEPSITGPLTTKTAERLIEQETNEISEEEIDENVSVKDRIAGFFLNIVSPRLDRRPESTFTTFKSYEKAIIYVSIAIFILYLSLGLIIFPYNKTNSFVISNLIFCLTILLISTVFVFTKHFFIFQRIFEFVYVGIIPMIVYPIARLSRINKKVIPIIVAISLIILLAASNLLSIGGNQRYYYIDESLIREDNPIFITPNTYFAGRWVKENLNNSYGIIGGKIIYDSIGSFGHINVRIDKLNFLSGLTSNSKTSNEMTLEGARWNGINYLAYSKYNEDSRYYKLDDKEFNRLYDSSSVYIYDLGVFD